jgi:selenocysteine lyase/cysteine desulfurase
MATLDACGIDYYTANAHKWLFSPKGSAVFWASQRVQTGVVPLVVSSEWHNERQSFSRLICCFANAGRASRTRRAVSLHRHA